jgi:hypothetical protein
MSMRTFVDQHYLHFNAGTVREACQSLRALVEGGGKIFLTLAGAMSTAEIGRTLAELIRNDPLLAFHAREPILRKMSSISWPMTIMFASIATRTCPLKTKWTCSSRD